MRAKSTRGERIQVRNRVGIDRYGNSVAAQTFANAEIFRPAEIGSRKIDIARFHSARLILPA